MENATVRFTNRSQLEFRIVPAFTLKFKLQSRDKNYHSAQWQTCRVSESYDELTDYAKELKQYPLGEIF